MGDQIHFDAIVGTHVLQRFRAMIQADDLLDGQDVHAANVHIGIQRGKAVEIGTRHGREGERVCQRGQQVVKGSHGGS